jgi:alpha-N-arabinofuranosidase
VPLAYIGSGPNGGDMDWTRKFFARLTERDRGPLNRLYGWALHYYCGTAGKGDAVDFTEADWYELLRKATHMETLITGHWAAMGDVDNRRHVKLVVDEWGAWHNAGTEVDRSYLFGQTSTMRDALVAALTLDIFNRHADKVAMANVAQLINNLHSLFLARGDKFTTTPNFDVFEMYSAHHHGQSLRAVFNVESIGGGDDKTHALPALAGSASLHDKRLVLTVVNPHTTEPRETQIQVRGSSVQSGEGRVLAADNIHAHNTFENPHAVEARAAAVEAKGGGVRHVFPPASVTKLELVLG